MIKSKKPTKTTYTYHRWDEEQKREVPITITIGQEGVTQEYIILLNEMDHDTALAQRYEEENLDYETENMKSRFELAPDESFGDPIENIGTSKTDPSYILEHNNKAMNSRTEQLLMLIQKLTPQQIDLIYSIFGECRYMADIAREEGASVQAINNRKNKIINRLKKSFDETEKQEGA